MTSNSLLQCFLYLGGLFLLVKPLGTYMANVYEGKLSGAAKFFAPLERLVHAFCGIRPMEMSWKTYAAAMLLFETLSVIAARRAPGMNWSSKWPIGAEDFPKATPTNCSRSFTAAPNRAATVSGWGLRSAGR